MATVRAWVSPRVNRPEPCARGTSPTSTVIGRMSVRPRPSIRIPSSRTSRRTVFFWTRLNRLLLTRASRRAASSSLAVSPPVRLARTALGDRLAERRDPARQVVGEPEQQVGGRLRVRQGPVALRQSSMPKKCDSVAELVVLEVRVALAGDDERVEVAARREPGPVAERLLDEAEVEADVVADDRSRRRRSRARSVPRRRATGRLGTSLSVMPCIWLPTIGRPGLTKVDQRSTILRALDLDGGDLDEVGHLRVGAGRLDVDDDELALGVGAPRRSRGPSSVDGLEVRDALGLADGLLELLLEVDERLERAMAEQDRLGHDVLGQELRAGLDHHDRVTRAGDDQVELRVRELGCGSG